MKSYLFILLLVLVSGLLLTACDDDGEAADPAATEDVADEVADDEVGCEGGVCPAPVFDEETEAADEVIEEAKEEFDPGFIHNQAPPLAGEYDDEDETK